MVPVGDESPRGSSETETLHGDVHGNIHSVEEDDIHIEDVQNSESSSKSPNSNQSGKNTNRMQSIF